MARIRGWSFEGERVQGFAPDGHWRKLTFLAAPEPRRSPRRAWLKGR